MYRYNRAVILVKHNNYNIFMLYYWKMDESSRFSEVQFRETTKFERFQITESKKAQSYKQRRVFLFLRVNFHISKTENLSSLSINLQTKVIDLLWTGFASVDCSFYSINLMEVLSFIHVHDFCDFYSHYAITVKFLLICSPSCFKFV